MTPAQPRRKPETHRTNISNIIIFDKQDASKILPLELIIVISFSFEMKTKKFPLDNTSTATTKTWNTQNNTEQISAISSFLINRIHRRFCLSNSSSSFHFHSKWKPKNFLSITPAQPRRKPETQNNTEQISATSSSTLRKLLNNTEHSQTLPSWLL